LPEGEKRIPKKVLLAPETVDSILALQRRWGLSMGRVIDLAIAAAVERER
jgi:hypothetical protein